MRRSRVAPERAKVPYNVGNTFRSSSKEHSRRQLFSLLSARAFEKRRWSLVIMLPLVFLIKTMFLVPMKPPSAALPSSAQATPKSVTHRRRQERDFPVMLHLSDETFDKVSRATPPPVPDRDWLGEKWDSQECVPMHKWQLPEYSPFSCNVVHEANMFDVELINTGGSRIAWKTQDTYGETMVIKTQK